MGQADLNSTNRINDACGKIHAGSSGVYHLSREKEFEVWLATNLSQFNTGNPATANHETSIDDFFVNSLEN